VAEAACVEGRKQNNNFKSIWGVFLMLNFFNCDAKEGSTAQHGKCEQASCSARHPHPYADPPG